MIKFRKLILMAVIFSTSGAIAETALEAAAKLAGTYSGSWALYGLDSAGKIVQRQAWTDQVTTSRPAINGNRAFIVATDTMTYPDGKTYTIQWNEGFFVGSDGSAGQRFFDTYGVTSIEQLVAPNSWIITTDASAQELQQLGIVNASYGKHVTVKNEVPGIGYITEYVTRVTTAKWTDLSGRFQEKQFVSVQGFHKHFPAQ